MPDDPGIMADIERDEQWLRTHAPGTPAPWSVEHIKLQVQIALDESRLEGSPTLSVDAACVARVKRAVRDELAIRAAQRPRRRFRRLLPLAIGGPLAAAAVVAVVLVVERPTGHAPPPSYSALDALVEFAEENNANQAKVTPLPDIDALEEEMFGSTWSTGADGGSDEGEIDMERLYDKLRDELDALEKPGTIMKTGSDYPCFAARTHEWPSWPWPA